VTTATRDRTTATFHTPEPVQVEDAAAFLAQHWPASGRHLAYGPLCGGLLRQVNPESVRILVERLVELTQDEEGDKRLAILAATAEALKDSNARVTGWPRLITRLGKNGAPVVREFKARLGLTITLEQLAAHKQLPADFLRGLGLHDLDEGGVGIPYRDGSGKEVAVKRRTRLVAREGSYWPKGQPPLAYGEERLADAVSRAGYLTLVEGESCSWTLWSHGEPALGLPGAETVKKTLHLGHVATVQTIYVVEEMDGAGESCVENVRQRLGELGWKGTLKVVRLGAKDASDLHCQDPGAFLDRWKQALARAEPVSVAAGRPPVPRVSPFLPFPVSALPEPVGSYVSESAAALGCDPSYIALPVLAVLGSLIGPARLLRLKRTWEESAVIWSVVVGDSGTLKTPAFKKAVGHLYRLQRKLMLEYREKLKDYRRELEAYKERKKEARKNQEEIDEEPPEKPRLERVVCSDVTIEKLAQVLDDHPRRPLVARDELAGWIGSFTQYKQKGGTDLPNWLSMHQAGTVLVDRKTGDRTTMFIENAAVSVTGGIQPGTLTRALTPEYREAGLPARVLFAMPPRLAKRWTEDDVSPEAVTTYENLLDRLAALEVETDQDGGPAPRVVCLSPEAKRCWVSFYDEWAVEQAAVAGDLAPAFSKLEAYAARFALIFHVVVNAHKVGADPLEGPGDADVLAVESMEAGITLARWFAREARRVYASLSETAAEKDTRQLIEFIQGKGGKVTARVLQRSNPGRYRTADEAEARLNELVSAGLARCEETPSTAKGGRPTRFCVLILDPTPDKTDTTDDDAGDTPPPGGPGGGPPRPPRFDSGAPTQPPDTTATRRQEGAPSPNGRCHETKDSPAIQNGRADRNGAHPGGCVSFVRCRVEDKAAHEDDAATRGPTPPAVGILEVPDDPPGEVVSGAAGEVVSGPLPYRLVTDAAGLELVAAALDEAPAVALDLETTGLDPRSDRVRLLSVAARTISGECFAYLVDCFATDPAPLYPLLAGRQLVGHHLLFDLQFLARLGFEPGAVHDTMLVSQLVHGTRKPRGFHTLAQVAGRELGETLPKELQRSDWSRDLTPEQLGYAARDVLVLLPLRDALVKKVRETGQERVADIERRCLPAVAWLAGAGVGFDAAAWRDLAGAAAGEAEELARRLDEAAPPRDGYLSRAGAWNWSSPEQVKAAFAATGVPLDSTDDDALAAVRHPLAGLLREYRSASKLASTYGPKWAAGACRGGRLFAGWRQIGADPGRMACASPNLQNLPTGPRYRGCFTAPPGRLLVKADYSQIELRIAAKLTGDRALLEAYRTGADLHTLTARGVLGAAEVTKGDRKLAKALNFGLLYGMGAKGFRVYARTQYGLDLTEGQASRYREAFFAAYPGLRRWHRSVPAAPVDTRTLTGRRRQGVGRFTEKLNTPVQGTGADGLKAALALLWERRGDCPGAFPVLAVHDEIVVECDQGQAEQAAGWLRQAMADGMAPLIAPVPVEVEVTVGTTWGGDP
jgi:DNA polymerase-1